MPSKRDAGRAAGFLDEAYAAAGATIAADEGATVADADIVVRVNKPTDAELNGLKRGAILVGFLAPLGDPRSVERYALRGLTALSMDAIPRTTKAQAMDALSSQANIAGYKGALIAASTLAKFFPMLTTAAGTIKPAKALIIGAGVAGLASHRDMSPSGRRGYRIRYAARRQRTGPVAGREILGDRRR